MAGALTSLTPERLQRLRDPQGIESGYCLLCNHTYQHPHEQDFLSRVLWPYLNDNQVRRFATLAGDFGQAMEQTHQGARAPEFGAVAVISSVTAYVTGSAVRCDGDASPGL